MDVTQTIPVPETAPPPLGEPKPQLIPLTVIAEIGDNSAVWGGKLIGLRRLLTYGFTIPNTWGIPSLYTFYPGKVDFSSLETDGLYAVRSGAKESMPGAMKTLLFVPWNGLQEAVEAVWASYYAPEAIAFRKAKGYPEDMGTAVAIQRMVPDIRLSGVCFTADPNSDDPTFYPMVEWVNGTGDQLVGGLVTPNTEVLTESSSQWKKRLWQTARSIHVKFGPSDLEFVCSGKDLLYLVQVRKLKQVVAKPLAEISTGTVIATGKSIGSLVRREGILQPKDSFGAGNILYLRDYSPAMYPLMLASQGIVATYGGVTSHAAVVAREFGLPALTGISNLATVRAAFGCPVALDGVAGTITRIQSVTGNHAPAAPSIPLPGAPNLSLIQPGSTFWYVPLVALRFYRHLLGTTEGTVSRERMEQVAGEIAQFLSAYMYAICCCEARHAGAKSEMNNQRVELSNQLNQLGVNTAGFHSADRQSFYTNGKVKQPDAPKARQVVSLLVQLYNDVSWPGASYGGKKWGGIASVLDLYLNGKLTDVAFCDASFNLAHNGGSMFYKFAFVFSDQECLGYILSHARLGTLPEVFRRLDNAMVRVVSYWLTQEMTERYLSCETLLPQKGYRILWEALRSAYDASSILGSYLFHRPPGAKDISGPPIPGSYRLLASNEEEEKEEETEEEEADNPDPEEETEEDNNEQEEEETHEDD